MPGQPERKLNRMVDSYADRVVHHLNDDFVKSATRGDRFADWVAAKVGSWVFIGSQSVLLGLWVIWNLNATGRWLFDRPPFIGLNLLLSFQAAYTAPFIMMSANRMAKREHLEAEIDYAINFKAEDEVADIQHDLHHIHRQLDALSVENRELHAKLDELLKRTGETA